MMSNMILKIKIPAEVRFECPTCGKSFSNGKGLGGHKRIHMEKKRNHEAMDLQDGENGEKTLFSCPVCPQGFASEKALHGHMRKHPDRGWRGMRPPTPPPEAEGSQPLHHQAIPVAQDLVDLATGPKDKGKSVIGENSLLVNNDKGGENSHHKASPIIKSQKKFSCDICGKSFRTHQALGGHKSHHDDKSAPNPHMEQPEGFVDGISGHEEQLPAEDEDAKGNGDQPAAGRVFDFDLNELPKW